MKLAKLGTRLAYRHREDARYPAKPNAENGFSLEFPKAVDIASFARTRMNAPILHVFLSFYKRGDEKSFSSIAQGLRTRGADHEKHHDSDSCIRSSEP